MDYNLDYKLLSLKTQNKYLQDKELCNYKTYSMNNNISRNDFVKYIENELSINMRHHYYCSSQYINNYIFVKVWSSRVSAIETSNIICNYTKHKLKDTVLIDNLIILIFKKYDSCNTWVY